jgi:hypothetical protein
VHYCDMTSNRAIVDLTARRHSWRHRAICLAQLSVHPSPPLPYAAAQAASSSRHSLAVDLLRHNRHLMSSPADKAFPAAGHGWALGSARSRIRLRPVEHVRPCFATPEKKCKQQLFLISLSCDATSEIGFLSVRAVQRGTAG